MTVFIAGLVLQAAGPSFLVGLAAVSGLAVTFLPAVHAPSLDLRGRLRVLADGRVRGILAGTATVLIPSFLVVAYLPAVLHAAGALVVVAVLAFGAGQVLGTAAVPRLIRRRGARFVLLAGACDVTAFAATLAATRSAGAGAVATMAGLGFGVGVVVVPQQHRLFALVPAMAPVAMGLNGSAIYVVSALAAGIGGGVLVLAGAAALAPAAAAGLLALTVGTAVRPERRAQREAARQAPAGALPGT
jgi:DHA1 family inner membrane transport protein